MSNETTPEQKLRIALDLMSAGFDLKRQSLRRRFPEATTEEIDRLMIEWVSDRPPDCPGRQVGLSDDAK